MRRACVLAIGLWLACAMTPPARAASSAVGWWTRSPVASAPDGGIAVASAPDGPTSVAAVLVDFASGATNARLSLRQSGGTAPAGANVVACIVGAFTPAAGGPLENAPATACRGASVPVVAGADGGPWTADLSELVAGKTGRAGVAVVPAPGGGLWELQFDRVELTLSGAPASGRGAVAEPQPAASPVDAAPFPDSATFTTPTPEPVVVAPTTPADPSPSISTSDDVALTGTATRPAGAAPTARPSLVMFVVLATIVGVFGGVAHKLATGRLTLPMREVP